MIVLRRLPFRAVSYPAPVAAIGVFDGVHRGHRAILGKGVERAKALRGTSIAVTFHPHPVRVLRPGEATPLLLSLDQRLDRIASCGVQVALVVPFTRRFSRWTPETFVRRLLVDRLGVREVVIGHDFRFGAGREGTVEALVSSAARLGFRVHRVGPILWGGRRVSSGRIRRLIAQGNLETAKRLLGCPPTVAGRVIHGEGRGRGLEFPTANLKIEVGVLPPWGVYAVRARWGRRAFDGMANLGFRPTFLKIGTRYPPGTWYRKKGPLLEVHLFGIRRNLYQARLEVEFHRRIRAERRFPSPEALARQLSRDAQHAKEALSSSRK